MASSARFCYLIHTYGEKIDDVLAFILRLSSTAEELSMNKVLGPRNLRAILGETYEIYRKHFWRLSGIVAIVQGPIFLLIGFSAKIESPSLLILGILIPSLFIIVASPLMIGALIHAVSEQFFRQTISISRSYNFAWKRLSTLIGSFLLAILGSVGIAFALFVLAAAISFLLRPTGNIGPIIPFIPMIVIFCLVISCSFMWEGALLEGLSSKAAVLRSFFLIKGNWWRVFGMMFVLGIIITPINVILGKIPGIGEIIGSIITTPFSLIVHILLYYDLRLRKEGYSVETLAEELNIDRELRITKVWENLSNEAFTLYQQGQLSEASQRLQDALKAAEEALGSDHLDVATILNNLASLYKAQGKYGESEHLYKQALTIREKTLGPDHLDVANVLENMEELFKKIGKEDEAVKLATRAKKIRSNK